MCVKPNLSWKSSVNRAQDRGPRCPCGTGTCGVGLLSRFVTGLQVDQRGHESLCQQQNIQVQKSHLGSRMALLGREVKRSAAVPRLKTLGAFIRQCRAEASAQTALEHTHAQVCACICVSASKTCSVQTLMFPKFQPRRFFALLNCVSPKKKANTLQPCRATDRSHTLLQLHAHHHHHLLKWCAR